ncbi:hypothetical protein ACRALDRAFT_2111585 [Sodiomyces alcalophilus JCM 7366]|uniref:uncharacterized protein n=1 Tax=Sodiomyces alcalophilus JCM 7366 TaxID=591952 RepID=UPI0039B4E2E3
MTESQRRSDRRRGKGRGPRRGPPNRGLAQPNGHGDSASSTAPASPQESGKALADEIADKTVGLSVSEPVPLASRRFAELSGGNQVHPLLVQTITEDMKFEFMTPVQAATLDELLPPKRSDCLVQAKTGTGKTLAFLLPALQTMITQNRPADAGISLLVISPTRELAMQISAEATKLLQRMPQYRVRIAIGGTNKDREEKQILGGCEILVATPGRMLDHMSNEDIIYAMRNLNSLVLDEADRLLDMGFMRDLTNIVNRLPDKKETNRQGMLFSATIAPHVEQVAGLVLSPGYKFISTVPAGEANIHQRVPQYLVEVPSFGAVAPAMVSCVRQEAARDGDFKAIIFAPTAALADFYGHVLAALPGLPPVTILHSRMSQNRRTKITNEYREARNAVLVATDVVARGMDFPGISTVIQIGLPADKESYIHRLGRTARADADGRGIFITTEAEAAFPKWTLKDITFIRQEPDLSAAEEVLSIAETMEEHETARIYQAWLGYYHNHLRILKWDKEELVRQANVYAREGLGSPDTPPIGKSTAGKMGLRGVRGLVVVPERPGAKQNSGNGGGGGGRGGGGRRNRGGRA